MENQGTDAEVHRLGTVSNVFFFFLLFFFIDTGYVMKSFLYEHNSF